MAKLILLGLALALAAAGSAHGAELQVIAGAGMANPLIYNGA